MRRGRRRISDVDSLENELKELKERQAQIRVLLRRHRNSAGEIRKLEERLSSQLAGAKWTASKIKELKGDWDELAFYSSVPPKAPAPRGRRRRTPAEAAG